MIMTGFYASLQVVFLIFTVLFKMTSASKLPPFAERYIAICTNEQAEATAIFNCLKKRYENLIRHIDENVLNTVRIGKGRFQK